MSTNRATAWTSYFVRRGDSTRAVRRLYGGVLVRQYRAASGVRSSRRV